MLFRVRIVAMSLAMVLICTAAFSVATNSVAAHRDEWSHPAGFKFWLPDNWKTKEEDGMLVAEGGGAAVIFLVPKNSRDMDRAIDEVDEELSGWMKNIKFDKPTVANKDGLAEVFITGTGKDRETGEDMEFDLGIYEKKGKILMVFGCTSAENFDKYDKTFVKILDSIR